MGKRHIVHLLPEESVLSCLQQARMRLLNTVGHNKSLLYPVPHITLIYTIENPGAHAALPILEILSTLKSASRHFSPFSLDFSLIGELTSHVTLELSSTKALCVLRSTLHQQITAIAVKCWGPGACEIKAEEWPHVTLAQDIDIAKQPRAIEIMRTKYMSNLPSRINFDRLCLLTREVDSSEPYSIENTYTLSDPPLAQVGTGLI